ncbi:hypothetical protein EWM64_g7327, partial [Hericium alpestre]
MNTVTKKNAYPLPRIDDSYQNLRGARVFTSLDLHTGYWQAMMNDVLRDYLDKFVMVYLDDVIIYSPDIRTHVQHVYRVLERLHLHGLVLNETKCSWAKEELLYLGHIITAQGIKPNPDKVKAILTWPTPTTITQVRGFLNIAGYYRRFMGGFAKLASPLYDLLHGSPGKGTPVQWSVPTQRAFDEIKRRLTSTPVLSYPEPWKLFVIDSDASGDSIGGVLQQATSSFNNNKEEDRFRFIEKDLRPIAYESRRLTDTERRYSAQEREMLAIDYLLQKFRQFIEGSPILVRTDHESLKHFLTQKHLGRRLARFADNIAHFDVKIIYRPGKNQLAADALSRRTNENVPESSATGQLFTYPMTEQDMFGSEDEDEMQDAEERDRRRSAVFAAIQKRKENLRLKRSQIQNQEEAEDEEDEQGYVIRDDKLFRNVQGQYYEVPDTAEEAEKVLYRLHVDLGHLAADETLRAARKRILFVGMADIVDVVVRRCES